MSVTEYGQGNVDGEDVLVYSRLDRGNGVARPYIYCHGAGGADWPIYTAPSAQQLVHLRVVNGPNPRTMYRGITTPLRDTAITAPGGDPGSSWGNDAMTAQVHADFDHLCSFGGAKPGRRVLFAGSMGTITAWRYAQAHPDLVAGVVANNPACDLAYFRGRDAAHTGADGPSGIAYGSFYAAINAAHHITTDSQFDALNANPMDWAGGLGIPTLMFINLDDVIVNSPTQQEQFAATFPAGQAEIVASPSGNHFVSHMTAEPVLAFLDRLDWS